MIHVALRPRKDDWPFSGYFWGRREQICWAGCIGVGKEPMDDWNEAKRMRSRLSGLSGLQGDKKGAIATFLSVLEKEKGGGRFEEYLSILVAAWDGTGVAISGFGMTSILGMEHPGAVEVWLDGGKS